MSRAPIRSRVGPAPAARPRRAARSNPASAQFSLDHYPFFLMNRAAGAYNEAMESALSGARTNPLNWRILMILNDLGEASVSVIAEMAMARLSTLTRAVQRLQADGLVRTATSKEDRRVTIVTLTRTGRKETQRVRAVAQKVFDAAAGDLSSHELMGLNEMLRRIFENLNRSPHRPED